MKSFFRRYWLIFASLGVLLVVYNAWFFAYGIRTHGDWTFFNKETMTSLRLPYFTTWLSDYSFGRVLIDAGQAPTYFLYGVFAHVFGFEYAISERLIHLWPSVLLTPIGAYLLVRYVTKSSYASAVGAVVYSTNTYFLILQTGHLTLAVAYAITPFVVLSYMKALDLYSLRYGVLAGLLLAASSAYEPRAAYVLCLVLLVYSIYKAIPTRLNRDYIKQLIMIALYSFIPIFIYLLLNIYWILGLVNIDNAAGNGILSRDLFGKDYSKLTYALTLYHPFWNFGKPIPFLNNPIPYYFWLVPTMALAGVYACRKNAKILFFGFLALLGVLLTKQSDIPFPNVYSQLFNSLPGFSAFREASKFYAIIALSYTVLIAAFSYWMSREIAKRISRREWKLLRFVPLVVVALLFLPNLLPVMNRTIATTFVDRSIPKDYVILNDYIDRQSDYFRVFWLPKDSRWGMNTSLHPRVDSAAISETDWKSFITDDDKQSKSSSFNALFNKNFSAELLNTSSIKYVVVPIRDSGNDDDFFFDYGHNREEFINNLNNISYLKKIDIGTSELAIYENKSFDSYIQSFADLKSIPNYDSINDYSSFASNALGSSSFNFITNEVGKSDAATQYAINNPFTDAKLRSNAPTNTASKLYVDAEAPQYGFKATPNSVNFYRLIENNVLNGGRSFGENRIEELQALNINASAQYAFGVGDRLYNITKNKAEDRFIGYTKDPIRLFSVSPTNLVRNGSFEDGFWESQVGDCNKYDSDSDNSQVIDQKEYIKDRSSIRLGASKHTACTDSASIEVNPNGYYSIQLSYQIRHGQRAGYEVVFNDTKRTVISRDARGSTFAWHKINDWLRVPDGATEAKIRIKGYPDETNKRYATTNYDDVQLHPINLESEVSQKYTTKYTIEGSYKSNSTLSVDASKISKNLITNPSLENGLWREVVGDCNKYDDKPAIGQSSVNDSTNGKKSILLYAARHVACTGPDPIDIKEGRNYILEFDYKSPNSKQAGYNIRFDDEDKTQINKRLDITSPNWTRVAQSVQAPYGAKRMYITVYSYPDDYSTSKQFNLYDNLSLRQIPYVNNRYYVASSPTRMLQKPKSIESKSLGQTQKQIFIKGSSTPFYMTMSELYNSGWKLSTSATKQVVNEKNHYKLNNYLNTWYLDPTELCKSDAASCQKNNDGSYNISMVAEFTPQKYLHIGLVISITTFVVSIMYLIRGYLPKRHHFKGWRYNGPR